MLDDNNYPFSNGRVPGESDPNEFIVLRLDEPLAGGIWRTLLDRGLDWWNGSPAHDPYLVKPREE